MPQKVSSTDTSISGCQDKNKRKGNALKSVTFLATAVIVTGVLFTKLKTLSKPTNKKETYALKDVLRETASYERTNVRPEKVTDVSQKTKNPFLPKKDNTPIQVKVTDTKPANNTREATTEQISNFLKTAVQKMSKKGIYHPQKIDKMLTFYFGKENTREIKFYTDVRRGMLEGRKKTYKAKDGKIYVLESRVCKSGVITRLYLAIDKGGKPLNKFKRLYLSPDGNFVKGAYYNSRTHLNGDNNALSWIRQATI